MFFCCLFVVQHYMNYSVMADENYSYRKKTEIKMLRKKSPYVLSSNNSNVPLAEMDKTVRLC